MFSHITSLITVLLITSNLFLIPGIDTVNVIHSRPKRSAESEGTEELEFGAKPHPENATDHSEKISPEPHSKNATEERIATSLSGVDPDSDVAPESDTEDSRKSSDTLETEGSVKKSSPTLPLGIPPKNDTALEPHPKNDTGESKAILVPGVDPDDTEDSRKSSDTLETEGSVKKSSPTLPTGISPKTSSPTLPPGISPKTSSPTLPPGISPKTSSPTLPPGIPPKNDTDHSKITSPEPHSKNATGKSILTSLSGVHPESDTEELKKSSDTSETEGSITVAPVLPKILVVSSRDIDSLLDPSTKNESKKIEPSTKNESKKNSDIMISKGIKKNESKNITNTFENNISNNWLQLINKYRYTIVYVFLSIITGIIIIILILTILLFITRRNVSVEKRSFDRALYRNVRK